MVVPPGCERICNPDEWRDTLVVIGSGAIELETEHGVRRRFERPALLTLRGRRFKRLVNSGGRPATLMVISRS
ncbi:MAG TPA: hypothetical protein VF160_13330 [Candidatus Dormibacteraeota bacterium]